LNGQVKINERAALAHLMDLLSVEGLSGKEAKVASMVRKKARAAGCKAAWIRFDEAHLKIPGEFETGNLIIRLPGTVPAPRRLLLGHLDTVPLCRGAVPVRRAGRIVSKAGTGLGGDNRTAVACLVTVLETILGRRLPHPPLTLLFTVGEEVGLWGSRFARKSDLGSPRMGFNIDGGDPAKLTIGALGADRWEVDVIGRSAHAAAHPEHGVSATLIAGLAIADVKARGYFGKIRKGKRKGTSNIGIIRGGETTNQITDHVYLKGESRSHDPRFVDEITDAYRKAFGRAARKVKNSKGACGKIRFRARQDYRPFRIDKSAPVVRSAVRAARALGLKPRLSVADGGLDANQLTARGIPTVTLGAGQHRPHTVDEYIDVREYLDGCRLALALATS
jgi:tripeptide aminopeptidase